MLPDMARKPRHAPGGIAYHVMNRTWGKLDLFEDAGDYEAFERVLVEAAVREPSMRVCAYCLMPSRWHLLLWPAQVLGEMAVKLGADHRLRVVHVDADSHPGHASCPC